MESINFFYIIIITMSYYVKGKEKVLTIHFKALAKRFTYLFEANKRMWEEIENLVKPFFQFPVQVIFYHQQKNMFNFYKISFQFSSYFKVDFCADFFKWKFHCSCRWFCCCIELNVNQMQNFLVEFFIQFIEKKRENGKRQEMSFKSNILLFNAIA